MKNNKGTGKTLIKMALVSQDMKKAVAFAEKYNISTKEFCKIAIALGKAGYKLP